MKVESAEFVKSAFDKSHWVADGRPEIAFLGRSNVGKSSLINSLLLRKGLARTSNTPGRTQSINFFRVSGRGSVASGRSPKARGGDSGLITDHRPLTTNFYFADLPGYGFARVSKTMRAGWGKMAEEYLSERRELALCIQLIDSRHTPTALDIQLNEWLVFHEKPHIVVATKADKISKNDLRKSLAAAAEMFDSSKILSYSAQTGRGRDEVWAEITAAVKKN